MKGEKHHLHDLATRDDDSVVAHDVPRSNADVDPGLGADARGRGGAEDKGKRHGVELRSWVQHVVGDGDGRGHCVGSNGILHHVGGSRDFL